MSDAGKARAIAMFRRLGEAEAAIHGMSVDQVHLHEVGALDSIIDIVGAVFALEWFKADRIVVSPINVGGGMVRSAHGVFPVPAPATVALLKDAPVYSTGIQIGAADADRRADPDRVRLGVRPGAADARREGGLRRRRSRAEGNAQRGARVGWRG